MEYEIKQRLTRLEEQQRDIADLYDEEQLQGRIRELEQLMSAPDFWSKPQEAKVISRDFDRLQKLSRSHGSIIREIEGVFELAGLFEEGDDRDEFIALLADAEKRTEQARAFAPGAAPKSNQRSLLLRARRQMRASTSHLRHPCPMRRKWAPIRIMSYPLPTLLPRRIMGWSSLS